MNRESRNCYDSHLKILPHVGKEIIFKTIIGWGLYGKNMFITLKLYVNCKKTDKINIWFVGLAVYEEG
jgi:hypothetical protein